MEVQELKQLIQSNNLPNFLVFTGDEWMVQKLYIQQIAKTKACDVVYVENTLSILSSIRNKSLLGTSCVYVVRDDKDFMSEEKLQNRLLSSLVSNVLILQISNVDNRLKFVKDNKDAIVEFKALPDAVLKRYIQKDIALNDRNTQILMEVCEHNYGRCLLEIDKIRRFADEVYNRC